MTELRDFTAGAFLKRDALRPPTKGCIYDKPAPTFSE